MKTRRQTLSRVCSSIFVVGILLIGSMRASTVAEELPSEPAIRVTLLGTGTPAPNPRQFGSSVLVEAGDTKLLFDCGRGCGHRLWNLNHDYLRQTSHLFITHMHSDHTVGIADLYLNGWNFGRQTALNVYGPAAANNLMRHLRLAYEEDVRFRADLQTHNVLRETLGHSVTEVMDGKKIEIGNVIVTPIAVDHNVVKPAFGYRIDSGGFSVVISGDTAYSENLIRYSKNADVLIHEVMSPALERFIRKTMSPTVSDDIVALHTSAPEVGRVFSKSEIRLGVLTHLNNDPTHIPELAEQIRTTWNGDFVVGEDLMTIEIGRSIRVIRPGQQ